MDYYINRYDSSATTPKQECEAEYQDDFAIIEQIVLKSVRLDPKPYEFQNMYGDILPILHTMFPSKDGLDGAFPPSEYYGGGLRSLLFLMLQVVIVSQSVNPIDDLNMLWKVYGKFMENDKKHLPRKKSGLYNQNFHDMFNLIVAFQDHVVRPSINSLCHDNLFSHYVAIHSISTGST